MSTDSKLAITTTNGKPVIVPPPVPLPPRFTARWAYLNARWWLYLPVFVCRVASNFLRVGIHGLGTEALINHYLHEWDYLSGGPGVLPDFFWWQCEMERDGSKRRPEHDEFVMYRLDGCGGIIEVPQNNQDGKLP